jgi:hypothetical protein
MRTSTSLVPETGLIGEGESPMNYAHGHPPPDLTTSEFPLLNRVLPLEDKIKKAAGQFGWTTVLNAVREAEAVAEGFDSLPEKVRQLIEEAEG